MKTTDRAGQETLRFSLPIEKLISAFHEAGDASIAADLQMIECHQRGTDNLTTAKLQQEILRAEQALHAALKTICHYQTTSLIEVYKKLELWRENACAESAVNSSLSPMEELVQSAYEDIGRMLAA